MSDGDCRVQNIYWVLGYLGSAAITACLLCFRRHRSGESLRFSCDNRCCGRCDFHGSRSEETGGSAVECSMSVEELLKVNEELRQANDTLRTENERWKRALDKAQLSAIACIATTPQSTNRHITSSPHSVSHHHHQAGLTRSGSDVGSTGGDVGGDAAV